LRTITSGLNGGVFAQMVFADSYVFLPSVSNGMRAFRASTTSNIPPTASFTPSCSQLTCSFDGTASTDPDGTITAWNWDFGDGATGSGATTSHQYAAAGSYQVRLTVTDNQGATGTTTSTVTVGQQAGIAFRGSATANGNVTSVTLTVPSSVRAGDGMLLFASLNNTTSAVTPPAGWQQVAEQLGGPMRTDIWQRVATSSDPGSAVKITLSATAKVDAQLLAYSGTSSSGPVAAWATAADTIQQTSHTTPTVTVSGTGSWVVSYWADKSSSTTTWTAPAGQTVRPHSSYTSGSAYITSLITDTGGPVAPGTYGGLTATTDGAGGNKATMATIVLGAA
jgi:PKD repeat protein